MHIPISYIIEYTPIDYHNMPFESSIRHISSYDNLLTDIEVTSSNLASLLDNLRVQVPEQLIKDWTRVHDDYLYFHDSLLECKTREMGDYTRSMMQQTLTHLEHFEGLIRDAVDPDMLAACDNKYVDLICLKDDKYNEHDKWYYD